MIWETVAALILILATFPYWIFAAFFWGLANAVLAFFSQGSDFTSEIPFEWSEFWIVPVIAFVEGIEAAWAVPSGIWHWAKFEHPWWAVFIGLAASAFLGRSRG